MTPYIKNVKIVKLKGFENVTFELSQPGLTFLMGENGIGKSSILHAITCSFRPEANSGAKDYRWPQFFMTYGDQNWVGTEIEISFADKTSQSISRPASEKRPRWRPNYDRRKQKDVVFLGIQDRVPHVETEKYTHKYAYKRNRTLTIEVISDCCFILGKDFAELSYATVDKAATHVDILCVKMKNGLEYTSATMGAGEQAVVKIIETARTASKGSLIVIDEPEALLHHAVTKRMMTTLVKISNERKLQILCSSHWPGLLNQDNVQVYSIGRTVHNNCPFLIKGPDKKVLENLLPAAKKNILWCEDVVAAAILKVALRQSGHQSAFKVELYGSSSNAFSIASHLALANSTTELVILDGDADADLDTVDKKLKKTFSGSESHIGMLRKKASWYFSALNPTGSEIPEAFLTRIARENLANLTPDLREKFQDYFSPADVKTGFFDIAKRLDQTPEELAEEISRETCNTKEFEIYTSDVIQKCRALLSEPPILTSFHRCKER